MESRLQVLRDARDDLLAVYNRYFNACDLIPFDRVLFELASRLRIDHRIKTPDALHLVGALIAGCNQFWTNDYHLAAGAKLAVWNWERINKESRNVNPQ